MMTVFSTMIIMALEGQSLKDAIHRARNMKSQTETGTFLFPLAHASFRLVAKLSLVSTRPSEVKEAGVR